MLLRTMNFLTRWILGFQSIKKSRVFVSLANHLNGVSLGWGLVKRFTFASSIIMLLGMAGIGWWVGEHIKTGVVKEATASTALYMDSFIAPNIQELSQSSSISPQHIDALNNLFSANNLGQRTVSIKIWNANHQIIYSNIPSLVGKTFPDTSDQIDSWNGIVTGEISELLEDENVEERRLSTDPLLEIYSPVRLNDTNQVIAVTEFYQKVDTLELEILAAQRQGWLVVGATMLGIYLLLIGFVQWANNRITEQEAALRNQVLQLTQLLSHNKELSGHVRQAAANNAAINESILRRISAELHDGPVQEIGLALLRLDQAIDQNETCQLINPNNKCNDELISVQTTLQNAMQEMRAIAASLGLPQLDDFSLSDVFVHVVRAHEQRTKTIVTLNMENLPEQVALPVKIAAYRFIQEGLNNAYRHANGKEQEVLATCTLNQLEIKVSDSGPGFDARQPNEWEEQLGLAGMRERIESLGGRFSIVSGLNKGVQLIARLSLNTIRSNSTYG